MKKCKKTSFSTSNKGRVVGGGIMEPAKIIETWFQLYEKDVSHYLAYYTGRTDIEDYVQDTFLKALRKIDTYQSSSHPKTWLIAIARNVARDAFRKNSMHHTFLNWKKEEKETVDSIEKQLLYEENQRELYRAIVKMKPSYRDVMYVRGILELNSNECAEILGWNVNKVNVTFFRALKKVKKIMEEDYYGKQEV